ncbi:hypothetical protein ACFLU5_17510 [Bacteroidota bacterium]
MPSQQRRLAAIMFTDIVGYTAMMESDEEKALKILEKNRLLHKEFIFSNKDFALPRYSSAAMACFYAFQAR